MKKKQERGFGAIATILIVVALAAMAAAIVRLATGSNRALADDVLAARALQAAYAGKEWGLYQALHAGGPWNGNCSGLSQTLDLTADFGLHVTVSCNAIVYNESMQANGTTVRTVRVFTLDAVACNSTSCPDNARALQPGYVERRVLAQANSP